MYCTSSCTIRRIPQFVEVGQLLGEYFDDEHSEAERVGGGVETADPAELGVHEQLSDQLLCLRLRRETELIIQRTKFLSKIQLYY